MMDINTVVDVVQGVSTVIAGASVIAAATPTPKDDGVLLRLRKLIEFAALMVGWAKRR